MGIHSLMKGDWLWSLESREKKWKLLSRVRLFTTPWIAAYQAPPSMGFSRQEYWSGLPLPSPQNAAAAAAKSLQSCRNQRNLPSNQEPQLLCCCSVVQPCLTLWDSMDCSMPGFPVFHYLLEFAETHVHWVGDAIQPSHPLSPTSPPVLNLSQHQGLFQRVGSSHQVAKVLELQHQSFLTVVSWVNYWNVESSIPSFVKCNFVINK